MKILVCLKQIMDPEAPARDFSIDKGRKQAERGSANLVTNIFCENALETALQFRERSSGCTISTLSYGSASAEETVRKTLAMKADSGALVLNQEFANPDPLAVARVLAAAARKLGPFDIVMVGREAGDWGAGQTGALLAEELGASCLALVSKARARRRQAAPPAANRFGLGDCRGRAADRVDRHQRRAQCPANPKGPRCDALGPPASGQVHYCRPGPGSLLPSQDENGYYEVTELSFPHKESKCEFVYGRHNRTTGGELRTSPWSTGGHAVARHCH